MKVTINTEQKKKRCYTCKKSFEPYILNIPKEDIETSGTLVKFNLLITSPKGNKVELCPSCKIQKYMNLGKTLSNARYRIIKNYIVKLTQES